MASLIASEFAATAPAPEFYRESARGYKGSFIYSEEALPLWLGDLPPQSMFVLLPVDKRTYFKNVSYFHEGKWTNISFRREEDPLPEGFTTRVGQPCYYVRKGRLFYVEWKHHYCAEPFKPLTAESIEYLLKGDKD